VINQNRTADKVRLGSRSRDDPETDGYIQTGGW